MAKLRQIELFLDGSYPEEERKIFIFKSRCICNYLERSLLTQDFETILTRVNIKCTKDNIDTSMRQLKVAPFLEVIINYTLPSMKDMDEKTLQTECSKIISLGLKEAIQYMPIPYDECLEILKKFENIGYKNSWIHTDKSWKRHNLRSLIKADLTTEKFLLTQVVYYKEAIISSKIIVETKPREMLFMRFFGKLKIENNSFLLYVNNNKILSRFNISEMDFSIL